MSDESFRAELRTWLAANITDEFREKRHWPLNSKAPFPAWPLTQLMPPLRVAGSMNTCVREAIPLKRAPVKCSAIS